MNLLRTWMLLRVSGLTAPLTCPLSRSPVLGLARSGPEPELKVGTETLFRRHHHHPLYVFPR